MGLDVVRTENSELYFGYTVYYLTFVIFFGRDVNFIDCYLGGVIDVHVCLIVWVPDGPSYTLTETLAQVTRRLQAGQAKSRDMHIPSGHFWISSSRSHGSMCPLITIMMN